MGVVYIQTVYPDTPEGRALKLMSDVPGYFSDEEGRELYRLAGLGLKVAPALAEIGSFHGRSTMVLGSACRDAALGKVYAIDPHEGTLYKGKRPTEPSLRFFLTNVKKAELGDWVFPVVRPSHEAEIKEPLGLLFIDGLHDYESVKRDIRIGTKWLHQDGYLAFHDYRESDKGVIQAVDEFLALGGWSEFSVAGSLKTIRRKGSAP